MRKTDLSEEITKVVFLDRDGVLNTRYPEYISRWQDYVFYPWTFQALRNLTESGGKLFLITNQSGIGRGFFTKKMLDKIHMELQKRLAESGGILTEIYYCPHHPEANCNCRKPETEMLEKAAAAYDFNLSESWVIGDHSVDIEAGNRARAKTIQLRTGVSTGSNPAEHAEPDYRAANLLEATDIVINQWESGA